MSVFSSYTGKSNYFEINSKQKKFGYQPTCSPPVFQKSPNPVMDFRIHASTLHYYIIVLSIKNQMFASLKNLPMKKIILIIAVLFSHSIFAQVNLQLRAHKSYGSSALSNIFG